MCPNFILSCQLLLQVFWIFCEEDKTDRLFVSGLYLLWFCLIRKSRQSLFFWKSNKQAVGDSPFLLQLKHPSCQHLRENKAFLLSTSLHPLGCHLSRLFPSPSIRDHETSHLSHVTHSSDLEPYSPCVFVSWYICVSEVPSSKVGTLQLQCCQQVCLQVPNVDGLTWLLVQLMSVVTPLFAKCQVNQAFALKSVLPGAFYFNQLEKNTLKINLKCSINPQQSI